MTKYPLLVLVSSLVVSASANAVSTHCTQPTPWAGGLAAPPRIPMVGDVDGDGYTDLLCLYPDGKCIVDVSFNAGGQKSVWGFQAKTEFGENGVGAVAGHFTKNKTVDVLAAFADGSVRLLSKFNTATNKFEKDDLIGKLNGLSKGRVFLTTRDQATFAVDQAGKVWRIEVNPSKLLPLGKLKSQPVYFAVYNNNKILWMDAKGTVWQTSLAESQLSQTSKLAQGAPKDNLVVANFDGNSKPDVLVGNTVLWDGDPKTTSVWKELNSVGTGEILAADMGNRGRDDLILFRRDKPVPAEYGPGTEPYTRYDEYLFCIYNDSDDDWDRDGLTNAEEKQLGTDPRQRDTDNDGLLDGWEVKGAPGFDFPKLGCNPMHKDVICEIQPQAAVDKARLERETKMVFDTYSKLNIKNPDGKLGIHFVPIMREDVPKEHEAKGWGELAGLLFPITHHGYDHWMVVYNGGGGQSSQMGDAGSCGIGAFWAVFIHEFGHQLGMDHSGFWPTWGPTFPSLMNYNYSYSFNDRWDAIHYSDGSFRRIVLNESDLDEVLPYPFKDVEFLSKGPYYFRLKADGKQTLIDWNWNGIFGEKHVKADVNYAYATNAGHQVEAGKTWIAPFLQATSKTELMLFKGVELALSGPGEKYVAAPNQPEVKLPEPKNDEEKRQQNLKKGNKEEVALIFQTCKTDYKWSDPIVIEPKGVTYDAQSVLVGKDVWVFYPTKLGVQYRILSRTSSGWKVGDRQAVPNTLNMQASPCVFNNRLYLVQFAGPDKDLTYIVKTDKGWTDPKSLAIRSNVPVGMTVDTIKNQLLMGLVQDQNEKKKGRWQVRRFTANPDGALYELGMVWVEGENGNAAGSFRPTVVFDAGKENGPNGRIFFFASGMLAADASSNWACFFVANDIAEKTHRGGWLVKLIINEWNASRSTIAATVFNGDIALAFRWVDGGNPVPDNRVYVSFGAKGLDTTPMGDFNEIDFIEKIGLYRPILSFATKDAIKK